MEDLFKTGESLLSNFEEKTMLLLVTFIHYLYISQVWSALVSISV